MKFLIVGIVNNPQIDRLHEEAQKKGHTLDACFSTDLIVNTSPNEFQPSLRNHDLLSYDLIYLWTVIKHRWEWYAVANHLNQKHQTKIVNQKAISQNPPHYIDNPVGEYKTLSANNLPFPKSSVIIKSKSLDCISQVHKFPVILKLTNFNKGKGIFKASSPQELTQLIDNHKHKTSSFIIREFIPNNGDIRVFTVNYQAIGAMKRTPKTNSFKSNISQGGTGSSFDLTSNPQIKSLAEQTSKLFKTEIAGVDIIIDKKTNQPYILEINTGPQFTGIEKYTQTNVAAKIIDYFESLTVN